MVGVNKKKVILVVSFIIGIFSLIGIGFNKQEEKILVSNAKEYKEALDSEYNFYNCAVRAYNEENKTELTQLTDVQLASIKSLSCSYVAATDEPIAGGDILKKMTSLESLDVSVVDNLDLSNNKNLKELIITFGEYDGILDLSYNTELEKLFVNRSVFSGINLSKNQKLHTLELMMLPIADIDLSNNASLMNLHIQYTQLSQINLKNNKNLKEVFLDFNQLSSIELSSLKQIESLSLSNNQLNFLELSNNDLLSGINISDNFLRALDLSNNKNLKWLYASYNQIETINLSNNKLLEAVYIENNLLKSIDLTNNQLLQEVSLFNNLLETIDLRKNIKLLEIDISYNNLKTFYMPDSYEIHSYNLYYQSTNQSHMDFGNNKIINPSKDLEFYVGNRIIMRSNSLELELNEFIKKLGLINLSIEILRDQEIIKTENVLSGDEIVILDGTNRVLQMELQVIVNEHFNDSNFYNCVIDSYNYEQGVSLSYDSVLTDEQLASIKTLFCSDRYLQDTKGLEKLTSLDVLELKSTFLEKIDLSKNTKLTYLNLSENSLDTIDLSYNKQLKEIYLFNNNLVHLNLSNNTEIDNLVLYSNNLVSIDLSNNKKLISMDLSWNDLESINLSGNELLTTLSISDNNLKNIDLSKNADLEELDLNSNSLTNLDLKNNKKLTTANVSWNNLKEIDLSGNKSIKTLIAYSNEFKSIDLSENIALEELTISSNYLHQLDLSENILLKRLDLSCLNLKQINLENNKELEFLGIYADLSNLDLSKNDKLIDIDVSIADYSVIYKNGVKKLSNELIKLPENLKTELSYTDCWADMDDSLWFDQENMTVTTNNVGDYTVFMRYSNPDEEEHSISVDITYNVNSVELMSLKYTVNEDKNYIYTGMDTSSDKIIQNMRVHYLDDANVYVENNKLKLKYNNELLRELDIININFGELQVNNGVVSYNQDMTVENLKQKITTNGVTYKIYKGEEEITSGNITKGSIIKIYKDEKLLEQYTIADEYLQLKDSLNVEKNIIYKLTPGITIEEILENVITSGRITVKDKDNNVVDNGSKIKTGYKISIELSSGTVEYTLSVLGDTNGDGNVGVGDVRIIANYIAGADESELTTAEELAANVNGDGNISVSDVRRLANYVLDNSIKLGE